MTRRHSRTTALAAEDDGTITSSNAENAENAENDARRTTGTADVPCREKKSALPSSASFASSALEEVDVPC
ncbi:MAG: hypothetical protein ACYTKD_26855 [Planctomycetota bacterium]